MYLVLTAAAGIRVAYHGLDPEKALDALIAEARRYTKEVLDEIPVSMPNPGDREMLQKGWTYFDAAKLLQIVLKNDEALVSHREDQVVIQLKEIQLSRQDLEAAAEAYETLIQEEVVQERFAQHGYSSIKESDPAMFQRAVNVYSEAKSYGEAEEDALNTLERHICCEITASLP